MGSMESQVCRESIGETCLQEIVETMKQLIAGVETKTVGRVFPEARGRATA